MVSYFKQVFWLPYGGPTLYVIDEETGLGAENERGRRKGINIC